MREYGILALGCGTRVIEQVRSGGHGRARVLGWWWVFVVGDAEGLAALSQVVHYRALSCKFIDLLHDA